MRDERLIRHAIDARLSGLSVSRQRQAEILRRAKEGEKPVKKKVSAALAFALLILLLAGTACAAAYGVLNLHPEQAGNIAYGEHIMTIGDAFDAGDFTLRMREAVFDGRTLSFSFEVESEESDALLMLSVGASAEGRMLTTSPGGVSQGVDYLYGFWAEQGDGNFAADVTLEEPVSAAVDFALRFDVLHPNFPMETEKTGLPADDSPAFDALTDADFAACAERFAQAYRERRILLTADGSIRDYVENLSVPQGESEKVWKAMTPEERLVASGAFGKADELTVRFSAQAEASQGELPTVQLGDYDVTFTRLEVTFAEAEYALTVRKARGDGRTAAQEFMENAGCWEFAVLMPNGQTTPLADSCGCLDNGDVACSGRLSLSGETDELIFVPCWNPVSQDPDENMARPVYDAGRPLTPEQEERMFTVRVR